MVYSLLHVSVFRVVCQSLFCLLNEKIYLLQCTSSYPTPPDDCNVAVVRHYHELSKRHANLRPGYSSHDFGVIGCMLSVAAGAKMVEKHVKFGDTEWAHFDAVAIDLESDEFAEFVAEIRLAERMVGDEVKRPTGNEHHKYWVRPRDKQWSREKELA